MNSVLKSELAHVRPAGVVRGLVIAVAAVWLASLLALRDADPGRAAGATQGRGVQAAWASFEYWAEFGKVAGQL